MTNDVATVEAETDALPEGWRSVTLGELICQGPQNGLYKHSDHYGSGVPIIRIDTFDNQGAFETFDFREAVGAEYPKVC